MQVPTLFPRCVLWLNKVQKCSESLAGLSLVSTSSCAWYPVDKPLVIPGSPWPSETQTDSFIWGEPHAVGHAPPDVIRTLQLVYRISRAQRDAL